MRGGGERRPPGVYREGSLAQPVHAYLDDGYELADVVELLGIGTLDDDGDTLVLSGRDRRLLRHAADAGSFDHAPEFIAMCLDLAALEPEEDGAPVRLVSYG